MEQPKFKFGEVVQSRADKIAFTITNITFCGQGYLYKGPSILRDYLDIKLPEHDLEYFSKVQENTEAHQ